MFHVEHSQGYVAKKSGTPRKKKGKILAAKYLDSMT